MSEAKHKVGSGMDTRSSLQRWALPVFLLGGFLLLGLTIAPDFGESWDDLAMRSLGRSVRWYVMEGERDYIADPSNRYHPIHFEILCQLAEGLLQPDGFPEAIRIRHTMGFLVYFGGFLAFCLVARLLWNDRPAVYASAVMFVLMPRIFGNAFINCKDIPNMSAEILTMLSLLILLKRPTPLRGVLHALSCALSIALRLTSLPFLLYTVSGLLLLMHMRRHRGKSVRPIIACLLSFLLAWPLLQVAIWPAIWESPVTQFFHAINTGADYGRFPVTLHMFMGRILTVDTVPWYYLPLFMLITIPIAIQGCALLGVGRVVKKTLAAQPLLSLPVYRLLVTIAWFLIPFTSVLIFKPPLPGDWRHLYSIYPPIALFAGYGFASLLHEIRDQKLSRQSRLPALLIVFAAALNLGSVLLFMIHAHPYPTTYFNRIVGGLKGAKPIFYLDYWGLSYRRALEWILESDPRDRIYIAQKFPVMSNLKMFSQKERSRFVPVPPDDPRTEYHFRGHRGFFKPVPGKKVYSLKVDGTVIHEVYRRKHKLSPEELKRLDRESGPIDWFWTWK